MAYVEKQMWNIRLFTGRRSCAGKAKRRRLAVRARRTVTIVFLLLIAIIGGAAWGGYTYLHNTAYLTETESGMVAVYRGVPGDVLGFSYSELVEETDIPVADLSPSAADRIAENMRVSSVDEALALVE